MVVVEVRKGENRKVFVFGEGVLETIEPNVSEKWDLRFGLGEDEKGKVW